MKLTKYIMACILAFSLAGCIDDEPSNNPITYGDGYITVLLSTDKAAYQPGRTGTTFFEKSSRRAGDHSL